MSPRRKLGRGDRFFLVPTFTESEAEIWEWAPEHEEREPPEDSIIDGVSWSIGTVVE